MQCYSQTSMRHEQACHAILFSDNHAARYLIHINFDSPRSILITAPLRFLLRVFDLSSSACFLFHFGFYRHAAFLLPLLFHPFGVIWIDSLRIVRAVLRREVCIRAQFLSFVRLLAFRHCGLGRMSGGQMLKYVKKTMEKDQPME